MEVESKPKPKPEAIKQVKQEGGSEARHTTSLKLGIKKNRNGIWEVGKPENLHPPSSNGLDVIPMSNSATCSGSDGEDLSNNQNSGGPFGYSTTNTADFGSLSPNMNPATVVDAGIIVLSESDDETENLMASEPLYKNDSFSVLPHTEEDPALIGGGSSCLGLFNTSDVDFGVPFWSLPSQGGASLQLFDSENVGPTSMDCFLTDEIGMSYAPLVNDSSIFQTNLDINDNSLVDNPLAFGHDDPSLQLFLPTRPPFEAAEQMDLRDQPTVSNGLQSDDWISLRLGGSNGFSCEQDNGVCRYHGFIP